MGPRGGEQRPTRAVRSAKGVGPRDRAWGMRSAYDASPAAARDPPGMEPSHARVHLEPERGRHQRKGKMLPDRGRTHGFRERKIATEHGHHHLNFEEGQTAPWTDPWPAPKRHQGWGRVATPRLQGRGQPASRLKLSGGGKRLLLQAAVPREEKDGGAGR